MSPAVPPQLVNVNGVLVERDALNIAERVHAYDSNLSVKFLNDAARTVTEPPYMVVEQCRDGVERPLFSVWKLDELVLQRIFAADNEKFKVLEVLDHNNNRARTAEKRRYREGMEQAKEVVAAVVRSPKDTYTVPENIVRGETHGEAHKKVKFTSTPISD